MWLAPAVQNLHRLVGRMGSSAWPVDAKEGLSARLRETQVSPISRMQALVGSLFFFYLSSLRRIDQASPPSSSTNGRRRRRPRQAPPSSFDLHQAPPPSSTKRRRRHPRPSAAALIKPPHARSCCLAPPHAGSCCLEPPSSGSRRPALLRHHVPDRGKRSMHLHGDSPQHRSGLRHSIDPSIWRAL